MAGGPRIAASAQPPTQIVGISASRGRTVAWENRKCFPECSTSVSVHSLRSSPRDSSMRPAREENGTP